MRQSIQRFTGGVQDEGVTRRLCFDKSGTIPDQRGKSPVIGKQLQKDIEQTSPIKSDSSANYSSAQDHFEEKQAITSFKGPQDIPQAAAGETPSTATGEQTGVYTKLTKSCPPPKLAMESETPYKDKLKEFAESYKR